MDNKIPCVATLDQKTLIPYYKYIVKDSPKTLLPFHSLVVTLRHFSLRYTTFFLAIIPLAMPFPTVYVETLSVPTLGNGVTIGIMARKYVVCLRAKWHSVTTSE